MKMPSLSTKKTSICILLLVVLLFAVVATAGCTSSQTSLAPTSETGIGAIDMPKSNAKVLLTPGSDSLYGFQLAGNYGGVVGDNMLLLWVKPVNPPSEPSGWFLQRPPYGVSTYNNETGAWDGTAQVGNAKYPPHNNDTFDVSVTVTDGNTGTRLLNLPGVVVLSAPAGEVIGTATNVGVALTASSVTNSSSAPT